MLKKLLPLIVLALFSLSALADEASVKKALEAKFGGKVINITKSPYLGLYEVYSERQISAERQIFYTDEKLSVIIAGTLFDGKTLKNVTAERMQKLTAIKFSELPLELAFKQVRGDGKRLIASFEDPNCGYCKMLAKDIAKLDNVTIYTFLLPILSPDSLEKSNQIWCSTDKAKAWNDWMQNGKAPSGKGDCDTAPIQKTLEVARHLNITGTPTIFFADGERVTGAMPVAQIEQKMGQASAGSK